MSETTADWRRWAVLSVLAAAETRGRGSLRTKDIVFDIEEQGWNVLPKNGRMDSVHATCLKLTKGVLGSDIGAHVRRIAARPTRWELTDIGRGFAREYLFDNPNITPRKSDLARQKGQR